MRAPPKRSQQQQEQICLLRLGQTHERGRVVARCDLSELVVARSFKVVHQGRQVIRSPSHVNFTSHLLHAPLSPLHLDDFSAVAFEMCHFAVCAAC